MLPCHEGSQHVGHLMGHIRRDTRAEPGHPRDVEDQVEAPSGDTPRTAIASATRSRVDLVIRRRRSR